MYPIVLGTHNLLRWLVLLVGAVAVVVTWRGWLGGRAWTAGAQSLSRAFASVLDLQLLVGLLLYAVFSPLTRKAFGDMGAAMRDPSVRYFLVEHVGMMLVAIVAVHVGIVRIKRAATDAARYQQAAVWLGIAFAAVAGFVPWARPLLPTF